MGINWIVTFVLATTALRADGTVLSIEALEEIAVGALGTMFPFKEEGMVMITETSLDEKEGVLYAVTERLDNHKG